MGGGRKSFRFKYFHIDKFLLIFFFLECCRGDIVIKTNPQFHSTQTTNITHSTTSTQTNIQSTTTTSTTHTTTSAQSTTHSTTSTTSPSFSSYFGNVLLISGGTNTLDSKSTGHSAEIFLPNSPNTPCILPDLPFRYYLHSQNGDLLCGGSFSDTSRNCRKWSSTEGKFSEKPVHEFKLYRSGHVSWSPVSENGTFLMGGGSKEEGMNSSTFVETGIINGIKGFDLTFLTTGACSIPDPETDTVLITGGYFYYSEQAASQTSLYDKNGFVEYFGNMNSKRYYHGCASYYANKKRV